MPEASLCLSPNYINFDSGKVILALSSGYDNAGVFADKSCLDLTISGFRILNSFNFQLFEISIAFV
jgi:hypothetical protein